MKAYYTLTSGINNSPLHLDMLRISLKSLTQNTSLLPYILYDGKETDTACQIFQQYKARVIFCACSFADKLENYYHNNSQDTQLGVSRMLGCFMKFDIPLYEREDDVVLYTDIDTFFAKDANWDSFHTKTLAAAPEHSMEYDRIKGYRYFSAGTMLLNIKEARKRRETLFYRLDHKIPPYQECWDQGFWNELYKEDFETWPLEFNWKPYWGINKNAVIVHLHGFKLGSLDEKDLGYCCHIQHCFPQAYEGWLYYFQTAYDIIDKKAFDYITQLALFLDRARTLPSQQNWCLSSFLFHFIYIKANKYQHYPLLKPIYKYSVEKLIKRHILQPSSHEKR